MSLSFLIQLVMAVVFLFALCWLPIHVIMVLRALGLYVNTPVAITIQVNSILIFKYILSYESVKLYNLQYFTKNSYLFLLDYKSHFSVLKFMRKSNFIRLSIGTISSRFLGHHYLYPTFRASWNSA